MCTLLELHLSIEWPPDTLCEVKSAFFIIPGLTSFEYLWLAGEETWDELGVSSVLF